MQVAAGEREHVDIYGTDYPTPDGTCVRDFVHVSDLTQAHLSALRSLLAGNGNSIYNLGNSKGYSVRQVVQAARTITGHPIPVKEVGRRPGDPAVLVADSAKVRHDLGWQPRYEDLDSIVTTAWRWHKQEAARKNQGAHADKSA
jgi:UDP-glucose 4-epimerase